MNLKRPIDRATELLSNSDLREWLVWKVFHPRDYGIRRESGVPPYLKRKNEFRLSPNHRLELPALPGVHETAFQGPQFILKVAGMRLAVDRNQPEQIFLREYSDSEEFLAIHRFAWLLPLVEEYGKSALLFIEKAIEFWIRSFPRGGQLYWTEAYTISERISNWGILLSRSELGVDRTFLKENIVQSCDAILDYLEFFGEALTGNHLANNGKGLVWGGLLAGSIAYAEQGLKILAEESKRIFFESGLLREGSTHYQDLVTRNYMEVYLLGLENGFDHWCEFMRPRILKMGSVCRFLRIDGQFSLIGDISPDADPLWFVDLPAVIDRIIENGSPSQEARGWASHFMQQVPKSKKSVTERTEEFFRFKCEDYEVILHLNSKGYPILAGHGHRDSGAPVVFHKGRPLLVDSGRPSYLARHDYFKSGWAHNSILVDGCEIELAPRGVFGPDFLSRQAGPPPSISCQTNKVEICLQGLRRKGFDIRRELSVNQGHFCIENMVLGKGKHKVSLVLHFACMTPVEVSWPEGGTVTTSFEPESFLGNQSTEYGSLSECKTMLWEKQVELPWTGTIKVLPGDIQCVE